MLPRESIRHFPADTYLTYPHCNGFLADGTAVLGRFEEGGVSLWHANLETGTLERLTQPRPRHQPGTAGGEECVWFDVAPEAGLLVFVAENTIWLLDLHKPGAKPDPIYQPSGGRQLYGIADIRADGSKVLAGFDGRTGGEVIEVDTATGSHRTLFTTHWWSGHYMYLPADETWVGFCHEGWQEPDLVYDRVWVWHPEHAPQGRCVFDQSAPEYAGNLLVGHEAWAYHDLTAFCVAYPHSPGSPRGLYQVFADGRPPVCARASDNYWHCGFSRDGNWAVVDTAGPHDGIPAGDGVTDIVLIELGSGKETTLYRSHMGPRHCHPHPVFSPQSQWILCNDARVAELGGRQGVAVIPSGLPAGTRSVA